MARAPASPTCFLNVDLDLAGPSLDALIPSLAKGLLVLNATRTRASLELVKQPRSIDAAIGSLAKKVQALPPPARALWDGLRSRTLNVGVQAGQTPHSAAFVLSPGSLALAAGIGARVVITVYAPA